MDTNVQDARTKTAKVTINVLLAKVKKFGVAIATIMEV